MTSVNFKREISDAIQQAITRVTKALAEEGFDSLSRIDPHSKIKEKTGKDRKGHHRCRVPGRLQLESD